MRRLGLRAPPGHYTKANSRLVGLSEKGYCFLLFRYRINQEFRKVARNYTDVAILVKPSLYHLLFRFLFPALGGDPALCRERIDPKVCEFGRGQQVAMLVRGEHLHLSDRRRLFTHARHECVRALVYLRDQDERANWWRQSRFW